MIKEIFKKYTSNIQIIQKKLEMLVLIMQILFSQHLMMIDIIG